MQIVNMSSSDYEMRCFNFLLLSESFLNAKFHCSLAHGSTARRALGCLWKIGKAKLYEIGGCI